MTVRQIYDEGIRQLPPLDRLRLATLILDELTAANGAGLDISDEWSPQDIADVSAFAASQAAAAMEDENA